MNTRADRWWLLCGILLFLGCVTPADRIFKDYPELKPADGSKSGIHWTKFDGFDFLVFYGDLPADPSAGAGIYQGGDPKFRPPQNIKPIEGKLGAFDVNWYPLPDKDSKFYRTCLIDYQKITTQRNQRTVTYTTKRHVWAYADSEEGLNTVIAELDKLTMFATKPPDIVQ